MTKTYSLINRAAGPRGIQTEQGLVMVQPALAGTTAGVPAVLTDDELAIAKKVGFEVSEETTDGEITGKQTSNLPAEGQIDRNTEEGDEIAAAEQKAAAKRADMIARTTVNVRADTSPKAAKSQTGNPDSGEKAGSDGPDGKASASAAKANDASKVA
jgi:hypothetical protein